MWLSYHIPLTDLRAFSDTATGKLPLPNWSPPGPGKGFVRGFGAFTRRRPSDAGWMGEPQVCDARAALRISPQLRFPVVGRERIPQIFYRQVAADGGGVVRMDLVSRIGLSADGLDAAASTRLIGAILDMPLSVHIPKPQDMGLSEVRLLQAGPTLANAWLWATTATTETPPGDGWVLDGMPILFMTLEAWET